MLRPLAVAICLIYGLFLLIALLNLALMKRPSARGDAEFAVLIPARDEEPNLRELIPSLVGQGLRVYVYDDDSSDDTAEVARQAGARVIPGGPLPEGWTGKSNACRALAKAASEDFSGDWIVFLDADVRPAPDFAERMPSLLKASPIVTGFPRHVPGKGAEPIFFSWVTWIVLATNPMGLVSRVKKGHSMYASGQVLAFRQDAYWELDPHQKVKNRILEDVAIGRLAAREGKHVDVCDLSSVLSVQMYPDFGSAWRGMLKNSAEIAGPGLPTYLLATLFALLALGWIAAGNLWWVALLILLASKLIADRIARHPVWTIPFLPISLLMGATCLLTSNALLRQGSRVWKGRNY